MKKTLLALLLGASVSTAVLADVYVMRNDGGGEITLTVRACKENAKWLEAYTFSDKEYVRGCWNMKDGNVIAIWEMPKTGKAVTRIYSPSDFIKRTTI